MIASIKAEKLLELANKPLLLEEKPSSFYLSFKKKFVFEFEDRYSVSHVEKLQLKSLKMNQMVANLNLHDISLLDLLFSNAQKNLLF